MVNPLRHYSNGMTSERTRLRMVKRLVEAGIKDIRVLDAMKNVPRHIFVDEVLATHAYDDVSLPIGFGQTISQPYTVARMTELLLAGRMLNSVLEIGTGCGYQTSILMAASVKMVYSIERIRGLQQIARKNLRAVGMAQARLVYGDGHEGLKQAAPYDGIIMTAAAERVPLFLLDQLSIGGRLVMPIGNQYKQYLWYFEKKDNEILQKRVRPVKFVPLLHGRI